MKRILFISILIFVGTITNIIAQSNSKDKPNLIIIHTDEHNFRTLGSYRNTLSDEQAFMWGKETIVETPNIDKIAQEGALCTNWYATSPVCTPSRASMITGLYPIATGSPVNNMPLNDDIITFGHILKENGYATSYVGKWHLDGDEKPGFTPERKFGFDDNKYMFNRGHWKALIEDEKGLRINQKLSKKGVATFNIDEVDPESFTTDFLVDRTLDIVDRDKDEPFCIMLSIPDPHGPNHVRAPYDTMYENMVFEEPRTMYPNENEIPKWLNLSGKKNQTKKLNQKSMAKYFGMVKCIDDNVGRILDFLKEKCLDKNTIVIFTSDHGDLMGEHGKHNKGLPYETSAKVAFIMKYPAKIKAKKQIEKAYTMADFTPTILGLMGVDHSAYSFHGSDFSKDFLKKDKKIVDDRIVYITHANSKWVSAVNNRYKLVMSPLDKPWLFDLEKDPDEFKNFYYNTEYKEVVKRFTKELYMQMKLYNEPLLSKGNLLR